MRRVGAEDLFVSMLSAGGDDLTYSTYLGGGGAEYGNGIAVASVGHAYVTGQTESGNFPTTTGAFQETSGGDDEAFVAKVGPGIPTAVVLHSVIAVRSGGGVLLRWRTGSETQTLGFNLYRERRGVLTKLNRALIRSGSGGTASGHTYSWLDRRAPQNGARLTYRLQAVKLDGTRSWIGATSVRG